MPRAKWARRMIGGAVLLAMLNVAPVLAQDAGARGYSSFAFGQCTWYASQMRPDLAGRVWGNAGNWTYAARASGTSTGYAPQAHAVAVFQAGVAGAWGTGHVAYVTAVGKNGWFQVSEMDFPRWGRVSSRWVHTSAGVSFIY